MNHRHDSRRRIQAFLFAMVLLTFFFASVPFVHAQVPEGEKETLPGFLDGLDYLTHPMALRTIAELIVKSGTPEGVMTAFDRTLEDIPSEDALYCWGRTFQSLIESARGQTDAAEARLSDATRLHAPTGTLRAAVAVARREIYAARTYASWPVYESRHFRMHYPPDLPTARDMESHAIPHDNTFEKICRFFEYDMEDPIDFYLYNNNNQCISLTGFVLSFALPEKKEIHGSLMDSLGHEQAHVISIQVAGTCGKETMMAEGIATYLDETLQGRHEEACRFFDREEILPIREMLNHFRRFPQEMAYSQAGSFLGCLIELYGRARFLELWKASGRFDEVFERVYGITVEEAETRWLRFLSGKAAEYREYNSYDRKPPAIRDKGLASALKNGDAAALRRPAEQYLKMMPRYSLGHYLNGIVLLGDGKHEEAAKALESALSLYPQPGWQIQDTHLRLVSCYYALGNLDKARDHLEQARARAVSFEGREAIKAYEEVVRK